MTTIQQRFNQATFNRLISRIAIPEFEYNEITDPKDPNFDKPLNYDKE